MFLRISYNIVWPYTFSSPTSSQIFLHFLTPKCMFFLFILKKKEKKTSQSPISVGWLLLSMGGYTQCHSIDDNWLLPSQKLQVTNVFLTGGGTCIYFPFSVLWFTSDLNLCSSWTCSHGRCEFPSVLFYLHSVVSLTPSLISGAHSLSLPSSA